MEMPPDVGSNLLELVLGELPRKAIRSAIIESALEPLPEKDRRRMKLPEGATMLDGIVAICPKKRYRRVAEAILGRPILQKLR